MLTLEVNCREKRSIVALIKSLGLKNSIHLMGFVKNIPEQMVNATCFVMTSDYEGMPNALIEAMCMGIPCIATDCDGGGAKALIRNGKNGVLIGKNDVSGLVESLDAIVLDPEKAEKMGTEESGHSS